MAEAEAQAAKARAKAAVLGALVADAATMGLHWIYKQDELKAMLAAAGRTEANPEFFDPPANKFYKHPSGTLSPYGNELFALLKHLAAAKKVDGDALAKHLASEYRALASHPSGPFYLNHAPKTLMGNVEAGVAWPECGHPEDAQANAFVKAPALVALLHGRPDLTKSVEVAVRTEQNNGKAVAAGIAAARILERVVLGWPVHDALNWAQEPRSGIELQVRDQLTAALEVTRAKADFSASALQLGLSCGLPQSLQNSLAACSLATGANTAAGSPTYVDAVRANIVAGGDNASRASLVGGLLAAEQGLGAVPQEWRSKMAQYGEAERLVDQLLA